MNNLSMFATLQDIAARQGVDKTIQTIIEYQRRTNEILDDMIFTEANEKTSHLTTVRTALPEVAWRMINRGVKPGKSGTAQISFTSGGMEALAKVDERLLELNGGAGSATGNAWRLSENEAFQQAMNHEMATTLFYGDEKINPAGFTGLGAYYYSLDKDKCSAHEHIIDAGGTGNNLTSIWFVVWGANTIHGFTPKGIPTGFKYKDNGRVKAYDEFGGEFYAYESQYKWDLGLAVRDYRYAVRVANIDVNDVDVKAKLIDLMIRGYNQLENPNAGKAAVYMNRQARVLFDLVAQDKHNVNLSIDTYAGKKITSFWGVPLRRCDDILNTEEQIVK